MQEMKNIALVLAASFCPLGCGEHQSAVTDTDVAESLVKRIEEADSAAFESWNGKLRGVDSDSILRFYRDERVVLVDRGIGITMFEGSYQFLPDDRVVVKLNGYREDWPIMILRRDGSDLVLDREDGHTSWLPKDFPETHPEVDGYWPFRSKEMKKLGIKSEVHR